MWKDNLPHGQGILYNSNGEAEHSGEWNEGKLKTVDSVIEYTPEGIKITGIQNDIIETPHKEPSSVEKIKRLWWLVLVLLLLVILGVAGFLLLRDDGNESSATVRNKKEFDSLPPNVAQIVIPTDSCNEPDFTKVDFSRFSNLVSVKIGDNCFENAESVIFSNMNALQAINVGKNGFTKHKNGYDELVNNKELVIRDCRNLENITVDRYSFSDYNAFSAENLPSLKMLSFGQQKEDSFNFYKAGLTLEGLNSLESLTVGYDSFHNIQHSRFSGLPKLKQINLGVSQFWCSLYALSQKNGLSYKKGNYQPFSKAEVLGINLNTCNDDGLKELRFDGYNDLRSLVIDDNCFEKTEKVSLSGLNKLQSVTIGKNTFTNHKNGFGGEESKEFLISNCKSLESVSAGKYAFSDYTVMVIELVPSMETIVLGDTNSESFNFYNASLTLRDLPSLKEVTVGVDSSHNADNSVIENTPQLEDLIMGESGEMVGFFQCG